jgi:hypothetical protein
MSDTLQTPAADAPVVPDDVRDDRLAHLGGEVDDIDNEDFTGADDGSDLDYVAPDATNDDKGDDDDKDAEGSSDSDDSTDGDDAESSDSDESSDTPDDDSSDDDGEDDDATGESTSEKEDDPEPDEKPRAAGIPKYRFDEVNDRAKTAEAELARRDALNTAKVDAEAEVYDFEAKDKELIELQLDGKVEEAGSLRKEIREAEKAEWLAESKKDTMGDLSAEAVDAELTGLAKQAESMYPVFDESHEDFDADLADRVLIYYQGYASSGKAANAGDAFVMALADVIGQADLDTRYGEAEPEAKKEAEKLPDKTKTEQKKKLAEQVHQPVAGEGAASEEAGVKTDGGDVEQMSDEDFDALPAKAQARLRGDFFEGG